MPSIHSTRRGLRSVAKIVCDHEVFEHDVANELAVRRHKQMRAPQHGEHKVNLAQWRLRHNLGGGGGGGAKKKKKKKHRAAI